MDPNATLRQLNAELNKTPPNELQCFGLAGDLREWLLGMGFAPHWGLYPEATYYFVAVYGWRSSMPSRFDV